MSLEELLKDKEIKSKEKTETISVWLLAKTLNADDLIAFAAALKDPDKATCIEALEFATKQQASIITKNAFQFVIGTLTAKAPRVKWESAKVIGNTAALFPDQLENAIVNLLDNSEHDGTVVRWSAAYALGEIIQLQTPHNHELIPAVKAICIREEKNSIRKMYLDAIKKVSSQKQSTRMTVDEVMSELASYGKENIKNILLKHGVKEPFFGVKIQDLKIIEKRVKKDYELALGLFNTGNADAMYLAGLIADDQRMTKKDLQTWAEMAVSNNINEYTVPWVCAAGNYGFELGMEWIGSDKEHIVKAGWNTLGGLTALKPDNELDLEAYRRLIKRVEETIHTAKNLERYVMNSFLIAVGSYVPALTDEAKAAAKKIGVVTVDMNGTACKVPDAIEYIGKVESKGKLGKKKKTLKC